MKRILSRDGIRRRAWALACALTLGTAAPTLADVVSDAAAISGRLRDWAEAFNARDATLACGLFAPDLIATVRGAPVRGRASVCSRLAAAMADPNERMRYVPDIQEIIVSGDLAVVRLVWTLTVQRGATSRTSEEPGLDIFRRQHDGAWSIIRYMAFSTDPDCPLR